MFEPHFTEPVLRAFHMQLSKEAAIPVEAILSHLGRRGTQNAMLAGVGSGAGLGLGVGALGGAATGGKRSYDAARAGGQGRLSSALSAVAGGAGGALRGAGKGALIGAGIGGVGGALLPTKTLSATKSLSRMGNSLGSLSNFGQRQVHSVTGWKPGGSNASVERIGAGAAGARREFGSALAGGAAPAEVDRARRAFSSSKKTQEMGLTSLPGIAKSVKDRGLLPTAGAGLKASWDSSGAKGKALMLGLPALSAKSALTGSETDGGPGKGERVGRVVGGTLGAAVAPLSLAGGLVLSGALEHAGGAVGKGVDRLRGRGGHRPVVPQEVSRPPATEPGDTGQVATERVFGTGFSGGVGGLE